MSDSTDRRTREEDAGQQGSDGVGRPEGIDGPRDGDEAATQTEDGTASTPSEMPPGPTGLPFLGSIRSYRAGPLEFYTETAQTYGPVASYTLGGDTFVQLSAPEHIEHVLVHNNQAYEKGGQFAALMKPMLGNGLLVSEGEFWRSQRRTINPSFHPEKVHGGGNVITGYTERRLSAWRDGDRRDMYDELMRLTVEIAAEVMFGYDIREDEAELGEALETVMDRVIRRLWRPVHIPMWLPTPSNREYRQALETLDEVAYRIIDDHQAEGTGATGETGRPDPVSLLSEKTPSLSREQIRDEVFTLLLAGHETTTLTLVYTLYQLSTHPEAAASLRAELDEVVGGRTPTISDLEDLTYMEKVLKESMRVIPPVYSMLREATTEDEIGGYRVPAGATVLMSQWVLHRDPTYYDDPTEFRPERWTESFEQSLPNFAYFPFGGGPRRCLGEHFAKMEAKLILATILQEWTFEPAISTLEFAPSVSLRPAEPVEMNLQRRDD